MVVRKAKGACASHLSIDHMEVHFEHAPNLLVIKTCTEARRRHHGTQ
jgi:hypothetical protein